MRFSRFKDTTREIAMLLVGLASFSILIATTNTSYAELLETEAKQAVLYDVDTRSMLLQKNADDLIAPASFAKLMTMEVVFNEIKSGRLSLDDEFIVSKNAFDKGGAASGGSTMFAKLKSSIRVEDLILGIIVQSANDGCIIIAEGIAGTEEDFVKLMNERAKLIGLQHSKFYNSTGLTQAGQVVTLRDLLVLAVHIQQEYPDLYKYYAQKEFTWNKIRQFNRNALLKMDIGADGMGTGFTDESGYALVGSFRKNNRHMIIAMSGLETSKQRNEEAIKILDLALNELKSFPLIKREQVVGYVRANGGEQASIPVALKDDLSLIIPRSNLGELKAEIAYNGPLSLPVKKGDEIAILNIYIGDDLAQETPLYAAQTIRTGPIYRRVYDAITQSLLGWAKDKYKENLPL